jgi:hypothetical protein
LIALDEPLTDHKTGIPICIIALATHWTDHERRSYRIAFFGHSVSITDNGRVASGAFSTGVTWIDSTGYDTFIPCLVPGILKDASLHPVRPFFVATLAILALLRFQVGKVFKDKNACSMFPCKLYDTPTDTV